VTPRTRIVAIATNPLDGASTRFRVLQWEGALARAGFDLYFEPFYSNEASRLIYSANRSLAKVPHLARGFLRRCRTLMRLEESADLLFIHRETFPLGWPMLLRYVSRFPGAVVYDYDDAMFLPQRRGRGWMERFERIGLRTPGRLMAMSDVVLAGNPFLADYARSRAPEVVLLPTCIDTDRFTPAANRETPARPVLAWIGSHTTSKYLVSLLPALERVAAVAPFDLHVVGCPARLEARGVSIVQREWSLDREVVDFQQCDIGVYPLSSDDWSQGKSGFKAIQFMACGIPVVASAVGVTTQIIDDGRNGFLARTVDEWVDRLVMLLSDATRRRAIGAEGRRTIETRYSTRANAPILIQALQDALARARGSGSAAAVSIQSASGRPA
jgi:glycosyltransferase involved in cell wall biosynthesis